MPYLMESYDAALRDILHAGVYKSDRTNTGCLSLAGLQCRYRLDQDAFPLLTRRKVYPKAIFGELLWFLSGSTNVFRLNKLGSKIWDPWRDESFERKHNFPPGDLGPVYGFQLRHFGGDYMDVRCEQMLAKHEQRDVIPGDGDGFDQLKYMMDLLRTDRHSRRIMFSLWNPNDLGEMRLPPCHFTYQVVVDGLDRVTGILTQRSADFPVGVPANIQFYSALTVMLAQQADLKPYEFVHNTNDSHIYINQVQAVKEYLESPVVDSPQLTIRKAKDIYSYTPEDFVLTDYNPGPKINIPVAV